MSKKNKDKPEEVQITADNPITTTYDQYDEKESKKSKKEKEVVEVKTVKTKQKGGCGTFFLGFLFAFIFLFVVVGGAGVYLYYNFTFSQVEQTIGIKIPLEGEIKNKSLKELIALGLDYKNSVTEATLETLNTRWGVDLPQTIPGTSLDISGIYNEEITFMGQTKQVKKFRLQDIANNLKDFVDQVLPKAYDHFTVGQILDTAKVDILEDLDYPGLTAKFYNIGTASSPNLKTLKELTLNQALDLIPEYYGSDNLTVQRVIDALGLSIMPIPSSGTDIYADLRTMKLTAITNEDLKQKVTGEILNDLLDLDETFDFAKTEAFAHTTLAGMGDYIKTVPLKQLMNIPETLTDESPSSDHLLYAMQNVTYGDLQAEDVTTALADKMDAVYPNFTLDKILDFSTMENVDFLASVKFSELLKDPGESLSEAFASVQMGDYITLEQVAGNTDEERNAFFEKAQYKNIPRNTKLSAVKDVIRNFKINQIFKASDLGLFNTDETEMTVEQYLDANPGGTFKFWQPIIDYASYGGYVEIFSYDTNASYATTFESSSLFDMLGGGNNVSALAGLNELTFEDIVDSDDLVNLILSKFGTLGDLLGGDRSGIFGIIADITIQDFMNNASGSIRNALENANGTTLAELLESTSTDPLITSILSISVADMFSGDPTNAIKIALAGTATPTTEPDEVKTLKDIFGYSYTSGDGIMYYVQNVRVGDLLGLTNYSNASDAIKNSLADASLSDVFAFTETTGFISYIKNVKFGDLFGDNPGAAIKLALTKDSDNNDITLGQFLGITSPTGFVSKVVTLKMGDLLGDNPEDAINGIIDNVTLADVFDEPLSTDKTIIKSLWNITYGGQTYTDGSLPVKDVMNAVYKVKVADIITTKPALFNLIDNTAYNSLTLEDLCAGQGLTMKSNLTINDLIEAGLIENTGGKYDSIKTQTLEQILDTVVGA